MKVRLPKVLCAALLASLICANSYAEIQADGIDYTHTANGDGTYDSTVKIGGAIRPSIPVVHTFPRRMVIQCLTTLSCAMLPSK